MEQTVRERPPQEQCVSQLHVQHRTVNSSGPHFLQDRGTSTPRGGDHFRQDKAQSPLCRDSVRGTCTRGASCRYRHTEPGDNGGSRFYQSEHGGLGIVSKLGNSQSFRESKENDSRNQFSSGGFRSRSPCRRFQSGTCFRGSSCPYLHPGMVRYDKPTYNVGVGAPSFGGGNRDNASRIFQGREEVNKENYTRTISFSREHRSRSPCRNFLRGNCHFGSNCRRFHPNNNLVRSRTDFGSPHHQRLAQSSGDGQPDVTLRTPQGYDEPNLHNYSRSGTFQKEPLRRSPCRNFLNGRCYRGETCAHIHPAPVSDRIRYDSRGTPHSNGTLTTTSRIFHNHDSHNNHARSTKDDMQMGGNMGNMNVQSRSWSSERHRCSNTSDFGGNKLEVCIRFTKGLCTNGDSCRFLHGYHKYASSNWTAKPSETLGVENRYPNTLDEKGDASMVDGRKRAMSGVKSEGLCNSGEGHEELSLWSRPFKRQRSRSRSPLAHRNDFHCSNFRRLDTRMDLHRDRRYNNNVAHFQYPGRRSHTFERPMYRINNNQSSSEYDSKLVGPQRHDAAVYEGQQLAQCSGLGSQVESVGKKNDFESASFASQHNNADQNNIAVDMPQRVGDVKKGDLVTDSASLCEVHLVLPEGNVELTNVKNEEIIPSMQTYSRDNASTSCQGPLSCEETKSRTNISKEQENGSIIDNIEIKMEHSLDTVGVSRRKLLVLDVNGILADIVSEYPPCYTPDIIVSAKGVFKRPFFKDFLQFCFERYDVGIWSSRNKRNVTSVVDFLMKDTKEKLLFCWDQSHCTATGYNTIENRDKPLVLKELKKLWDKHEETLPWTKGYYNESNTILLDDSPYKALRNPPYTAVFPYAYTFKNVRDKSLGPGGDLRVYLERLAEAENVQKFIQDNPFGQRPITKSNLSWAFYAKIVGTSDKILPQEKTKAGTSVGIKLEEKANIVGISESQLKEESEKLKEETDIVGISNESQLEEKTEIVDPCDSSRTEKETKISGVSDGSQLEEKTQIVGTFGGIELEEKGTFNGSQQEESANSIVANANQLEEKTKIVDPCDRSRTEEETKISGVSDGSQLEVKTQIVDISDGMELEEKGTLNGSQQEESANSTIADS